MYVRGPAIDAATYGYDRLYRLVDVDGPDGARWYAYDPVGNRTSKGEPPSLAHGLDGVSRPFNPPIASAHAMGSWCRVHSTRLSGPAGAR